MDRKLPPAPVMPKPSAIAGDWKKRALAAEAKLAGYKRLRELAERARTANFARSDEGARERATTQLEDELYHLDIVDPPKDFFHQTTKGLLEPIEVRRNHLMQGVATFDPVKRVIEVNGNAPDAAKLVGLLYQLLQAADMAAQTDLGGRLANAEWYQTRAPALLVLLMATGLLNPAVPVEIADVAALE